MHKIKSEYIFYFKISIYTFIEGMITMQGFETKEHEKELWSSLHQRSISSKFCYTGDATSLHEKLAKLNTYQEVCWTSEIEIEAIKRYFDKKNPPMQICDVGPGNGIHSSTLIKLFMDSGYKLERYLGLDFSNNLLKIGTQQIKRNFPDIEVNSAIWDFEKGQTEDISEWRTSSSVMVCFTGQTLGNPDNPCQVLKYLNLSCFLGDFLLLGVALTHDCDPDTLIQPYNNDILKADILEPLRMAGIDLDKGNIRLYFSKSDSSIIGDFVFFDKITLEYEEEKLTFESGDSICCLKSRRFDDSYVRTLLTKSGWKLVTASYDESKTHAVYLSIKDSNAKV
jgi:L-histidine N-alpha-methyltransferase